MSLKAFIDYLDLERKYSVHTVRAYEKDIRQFLEFCEKVYELKEPEEVSYPLVRSWIVKLVDQGLSNRSVNRKVASLKAYYKFLQRTGQIEKHPLAKHKSLKIPKHVEVPFSEKEMIQILEGFEYTEDFEGRRDQLLIDLLYATGMRRSELINLKMSDINLDSALLKVLGKRNKERYIPLLPATIEVLNTYLRLRSEVPETADTKYLLLTASGRKLYETLVYRIINSYFSKVSTKMKKSPHILRHTFATHLLNKGADLNSVKELLGHSSLASTQVYTHNSIAELKKIHSNAHPRSND